MDIVDIDTRRALKLYTKIEVPESLHEELSRVFKHLKVFRMGAWVDLGPYRIKRVQYPHDIYGVWHDSVFYKIE
jgi:hypothetical protein